VLPDRPALAVALAMASAVATYGLIVFLRPVMARYALARPNARSSHTVPTPQGGGIAIVIAVVCAAAVALVAEASIPRGTTAALLAATAVLAVVGAADDIIVLPALPRLIVQFGAAAVVVASLEGARLWPAVPELLEHVLLVVGIVWFVNLVNFMDGIDWISVSEVVPVTAGIAIIASQHAASNPLVFYVAICLGAAMLGFAPFNRPVAKLFLGDVGSLPIGLLMAWMLVQTAVDGHVVAAVLLPFYYVADATLTLARRLARRERIWQAHRSHFYQVATTRGRSVIEVVKLVFAINVALCIIAVASTYVAAMTVQLGLLALGIAIVVWLLFALSRRSAA
jgi:UDP-N-acetylmuramyl pentapeptide phosphotransferase/UDP-N-acetylglucosamine-1-phosphate transferase